jgi:formylglycine-generating enzyme required for sulfatase activity
LPTEAEWEYACRAGTTWEYCFGDDAGLLDQYAWYDKNSGGQTQPVGSKKPNACGLHDMHGNVWEWCADWFSETYYQTSPDVDPTGPDGGSRRVGRGGGWASGAVGCRAACRDWGDPSYRNELLGFRLARTVPSPVATR